MNEVDFVFDRGKHLFIVNNEVWPSITQVLRAAGMIDDRWFDDYSALRGTYVHKICELDLADNLNESTIDDKLLGYYEAWRRFRRDMRYIVNETEKPRVNNYYQFGGIADTVGVLNGKSAVVDIKTGAEIPATRIQTAAQTLLFDWPILTRYSLQLKPDGKYKLNSYPVESNVNDRNYFLSALSVWWWRRKHKLINLEGWDE